MDLGRILGGSGGEVMGIDEPRDWGCGDLPGPSHVTCFGFRV